MNAMKRGLLLLVAGLVMAAASGCGNSSSGVPSTEQVFYAHSVVFANNSTLWSSGYNAFGQLGNGTLTTTNSVFLPVALGRVQGYAAGANHTIAFANNSTIYAWGSNYRGRLGVASKPTAGGDAYSKVPIPVEQFLQGGLRYTMPNKVVSVAAGWLHSLAVAGPNRSVLAWGANNIGQLGNAGGPKKDFSDSVYPTPVLGENGAGVLDNIVQVAAGGSHSLALRGTDHAVLAWGDNAWGQVGIGSYSDKNIFSPTFTTIPVQVNFPDLPAGVYVTKIAAAGSYSLALMSDGTVWGWGYNAFGQLGNNGLNLAANPTPKKVKIEVIDPATNKPDPALEHDLVAQDISAGLMHALALVYNPQTQKNEVWSWGFNERGQLGTGLKSLPIPYAVKASNFSLVPDYATYGASSIYAFGNTSFVRINGRLYGWGDNGSGQLGYPVSSTSLAYYLPAVPILTVP